MFDDTMVADAISKNRKFLRVNLESVKVKCHKYPLKILECKFSAHLNEIHLTDFQHNGSTH